MKTAGLTLVAVILVFSSGCVTRPDWIEATLVTVDVTGVWQGAISGAALPYLGTREITLDLKQDGPKVTGRFELGTGASGTGRRFSGPLAGQVGGDVLQFTVTGGAGEGLAGELTVSHDEMEGGVRGAEIQGARIVVRRVDSPSRLQRESP